MTTVKLRKKFIEYFTKHKHKLIDSSSLWSHDDPSVLLTTAGMQQFKPYFMGLKDPMKDFGNHKLMSIQRCFRTSDIESVGDATHATFFEMFGNFSINDYFKQEAIDLAWNFLVKELHLNKELLWVTYFKGDDQIPADKETESLWKKFVPAGRIIHFGRKENWWGPAGSSGPCGPCSEIHYDFTGQPCAKGDRCLPNCDCGRFMEVWNLVFTEYHMNEKGRIKSLPTKNIDTGMGLERLALILQDKKSIYETESYSALIETIKHDVNFGSVGEPDDTIRTRIAADHFKGAIFLLADGVTFSNKEQGYILRRIFRRALDQYLHQHFNIKPIIETIASIYPSYQHFLISKKMQLLESVSNEIAAYNKILQIDVQSIVTKIKNSATQPIGTKSNEPSARILSAHEAFQLYSSYGLSSERLKREGFTFNQNEFEREIANHQNISRAGAKKKFGGHGLNSAGLTDEQKAIMTRYHTATHLLHQALRTVLGDHVQQEGSDITPERLRFDFRHTDKLTPEQIKQVEELVHSKIEADLPVTHEEMKYDDALKTGALAFFKEQYPEQASVYTIGDFSKELCGGPHVAHTKEIGQFSIQSEKSSSAGIRRIKAIIS